MLFFCCEGHTCPKAKLEFIDKDMIDENAYYNKPSKVLVVGTISTSEPNNDGWYKMEGSLVISSDEQVKDLVILKNYHPPVNNNNFIIDNVSLNLTLLQSLPPSAAPMESPDHDLVPVMEDNFEDGYGNFMRRRKPKKTKRNKRSSHSGSWSVFIRDGSISSKIGTKKVLIKIFS